MYSFLRELVCPDCEGSLIVHSKKVKYGQNSFIKKFFECSDCYINSIEYIPLTPVKKTKLLVRSDNDLNRKILTSDNCVIKIPELGLSIMANENSLLKVSEVINSFIDNETVQKISKGEKKITLLLKDPYNISTIIQ